MARWKELPDGLDAAVVRLIAELRRLQDETGLSRSRLAKRTGYSESSWERYLNGRALAPRAAVEALVALTDADGVTVAVLYDAAEEAWRNAAAVPADGFDESASEQPAIPAPTSPRARPLPGPRVVLNSIVSAAVGAALALVITHPWHQAHQAVATKPAAHPAKPTLTTYPCHFSQVDGKWYAGDSTTTTDLVIYGENGTETAEIQCLLQHAGISAGAVDGQFGPLTLRGVIQIQVAHHLDIDGQVGPQTWAALRG